MSCLDNIKNSDFRGYPSIVYEMTKSEFFNKECSAGYEGSRHLYSKTYSSNISESHLNYLVRTDSTAFNTAGQAHANAQGTCSIQRNSVPNPPLYLQAVDANNFYISSLEPFSRAEFTSSNPLPVNYLRNNNLSILGAKSTYPHVNNNKLKTIAAEVDTENVVFTNNFEVETYDSFIHSPSSSLSQSLFSTDKADKYSVNGLLDALHFNSGDFVVTGIEDERRAKYNLEAFIGYIGGVVFTSLAIVTASLTFLFPIGVVLAVYTVVTALTSQYRGSFLRHLWNPGNGGGTVQIYELVIPPDFIKNKAHSLREFKVFHDNVNNRLYTMWVSGPHNNSEKRWGRAITSISFNPDTDAMPTPLPIQGEVSPGVVSHELKSLTVINTAQRSGFLWGRNYPGGSKDFDFRSVRGTAISTPPSNVFNAEWAAAGLITNTVKDSTNPSVCYISLYRPVDTQFNTINRVISYNGSTNSWALIRKLDSY